MELLIAQSGITRMLTLEDPLIPYGIYSPETAYFVINGRDLSIGELIFVY